jgi:hypothetical protein
MDNLYYTPDEINQLQTDIINKHFNKDSDIKNVNIKGIYPSGISTVSIIDLIKEFEIIGYEDCEINQTYYHEGNQYNRISIASKNCKLFLNIYGDIYYGTEPQSQSWDFNYRKGHKENIILFAFYYSYYRQTDINNPLSCYYPGSLVKKKHLKKDVFPKIILSNIICKTLINNEINKEPQYNNDSYINIYDKYSSLISNIIKLLDLQSKLDAQSSQIQDLQSKLDEQTKLNETLCKRLFELKN